MNKPKFTDRHLHLSAATEPMVLYELIRENGLKLGVDSYYEFEKTTKIRDSRDLKSYISVLHCIEKMQSSPKAVERSTYSCFRSAYLTGCQELEMRWNPYKRCDNFNIDMDTIIQSSLAGMRKAHRIFGIRGTQTFCLGTDVSHEANKAILKKALLYRDQGVVALDLAGPVNSAECIKATGVQELFAEARAAGMTLTIHAGEELREDTEEELRFVLEDLQTDRVGHGCQIYRFPTLMKMAAANGVHFEICISSNYSTKSISGPEEFQRVFEAFAQYGIAYSINTDATYPLDTDIAKEMALYRQIMKSTCILPSRWATNFSE